VCLAPGHANYTRGLRLVAENERIYVERKREKRKKTEEGRGGEAKEKDGEAGENSGSLSESIILAVSCSFFCRTNNEGYIQNLSRFAWIRYFYRVYKILIGSLP